MLTCLLDGDTPLLGLTSWLFVGCGVWGEKRLDPLHLCFVIGEMRDVTVPVFSGLRELMG